MKFWGLLAMVAPIAHTTQHNFLIGSIPVIKFFIGQDDIINISVLIGSLPMRFHHICPLHIHTCQTSHNLVEESSGIHYLT